jgi:leucyl/phenylalanyl-tRNA--protein transferase
MPVYCLPAAGNVFPDPLEAGPDGLLAVGGNLSPERLIAAYSIGVFPWYNKGEPVLWWSPDPRCILLPKEFHLPRSLRATLKSDLFSFSIDKAFADVIHACAQPRAFSKDTWLTPEMIDAYTLLHKLGFAHSVETWHKGRLVGGLYGVALGRAFFGESMFYRMPDASKAAFAYFMRVLCDRGFGLVDCQQATSHLLRFGAKNVPRAEFMSRLKSALESVSS